MYVQANIPLGQRDKLTKVNEPPSQLQESIRKKLKTYTTFLQSQKPEFTRQDLLSLKSAARSIKQSDSALEVKNRAQSHEKTTEFMSKFKEDKFLYQNDTYTQLFQQIMGLKVLFTGNGQNRTQKYSIDIIATKKIAVQFMALQTLVNDEFNSRNESSQHTLQVELIDQLRKANSLESLLIPSVNNPVVLPQERIKTVEDELKIPGFTQLLKKGSFAGSPKQRHLKISTNCSIRTRTEMDGGSSVHSGACISQKLSSHWEQYNNLQEMSRQIISQSKSDLKEIRNMSHPKSPESPTKLEKQNLDTVKSFIQWRKTTVTPKELRRKQVIPRLDEEDD